MAKAINLWSGSDSFGRSVEVAERGDGAYFWREYCFNGYSKAWSKWLPHKDPTFETHGTSAYTGETFKYPEPQMFWGFSRLTKVASIAKGEKIFVRLPN